MGNGSGLVLIAGDNSNPSFTGTTAQVWHVAYPGGSARNITNDLDGYHHGSISLTSDSRSIVVSQEDTSARIWVANLDGSSSVAPDTLKQITTGKFDGRHGLSWSPDGRLVYVTRTRNDEDVWVMAADGTGQRQLTDDAAFDSVPVVSPDGRHIYFDSTRTGIQQIWRMEMDGSSPQQVTQDQAINYDPSVSPDGKWLAFASWRSGVQVLWKLPTGGGEPVRLTDSPGGRPIVSPDGKLISCALFDAKGGGQWRLAVIPADGGTPLKVLDLDMQRVNAPAGLWWTPDSRALVYVETSRGVSNVWRIPVDGGKPAQLTNFDSGQIFNLALSHDGRRLAVARGGISGDVVLISDLR